MVYALTCANAAEVEAQHRKIETPTRFIEDFHRVIHNFVVKIAAAEGMRMADECGKAGFGITIVEDSFKSTCRAG
jgi:hypothetical protein